MGITAEKLEKKIGSNLSESLGVRKVIPFESSNTAMDIAEASPDDGRMRNRQAGFMEITNIVPDPDQPRKEFTEEAIDRLANSLKTHGQLMPLRIRWNDSLSKWVVVTGERRYRAAQRAGLESVSCIFVDGALTDSEILQEQLIENCLREDLKPVEQAKAYEKLMHLNHWTARELAEALHVSPASVSRALATLKLSDEIQKQVDSGQISASAAYEIAKIGSHEEQRQLADEVVSRGLTRDETVKTVKKKTSKTPVENKPGRPTYRKNFKTEKGKVLVTIHRKDVSHEDILAALEEAVAMVHSEMSMD